jgi:AraC-like DNA-binding protein
MFINDFFNKKQSVAEGRVDQIAPGGADYSKHSTDELKAMLRPGVMGRNELKFKTLIRRELRKREQQGVAEGLDIGQEWMSDTELDQFVPDQLEQEWRELVGYDMDGNVHPLWINMTGEYEPNSSDPQHRAWMVKVANKWFDTKQIPNVKFFAVKEVEDELEWLVQIGQQGVAEGNRFDEPLTGYHIVYKNSGNPVLNTPSFETKDQAQKYLMTKMFANHQDFKVVHTANVGVAEGAVEDLAKDLKNPHSYNAIDHMMQTIANKSNVTPKELHDQFVEKYGMTPDEWIKNEQGVEETYGAKLHTEYKRNRFKQLDKIKQQQEKALGLGEAGCNMTNEGRYCSEHGMMECPGYSMTETSVQDKLHQQHQELRKKRGLPDPSYYKKLAAQKQAEIDALRAEIAADQAKSMKESLRPGERHHYEDDPKTGKRVYKGIRGDQYDAPKKKTTGHEPDADRDRAAHRAHDRSMTESIESYMEELERAGYGLQEEKVRLDPKCWKGKKIGSPKTKVKGGVRVNNCVPK